MGAWTRRRRPWPVWPHWSRCAPAPASYKRSVDTAIAAGATAEEMVDTLTAVAPTVGLARVVSAAPGLALALGYDIDRALESIDDLRRLVAGQEAELVHARDRLAA